MAQVIYRRGGLSVQWLSRADWGASQETEDWVAGRRSYDRLARVSVHIHHTAAVDDDATPNRWPFDRAVEYQQRLQWVRPDLGPLPYAENAYISEDATTVWLMEGRGALVAGAHTRGYNLTGHGLAFGGDFSRATTTDVLAAAVATIELRCGDLRHRQGFDNLGSRLSPQGWEVWGHRDSKATACPGDLLYPQLAHVRFVEGDEMRGKPPDETIDAAFALGGFVQGDPAYWKALPDGDPAWADFWWAVDQQLPVSLVNIPAGEKGDPGPPGPPGDYTVVVEGRIV